MYLWCRTLYSLSMSCPAGSAVDQYTLVGGCAGYSQVKLARTGREQPKLGRSALKGQRVRVQRSKKLTETRRRTKATRHFFHIRKLRLNHTGFGVLIRPAIKSQVFGFELWFMFDILSQ